MPRFKVSLRVALQSSCTYHPSRFLLKAPFALRVTPPLFPVPSRNDPNPHPVLGLAALGSGPSVNPMGKLKLAWGELKVVRYSPTPMKPTLMLWDPWTFVKSTA